jgi:acetylornithine deacetylase/succinyl-diaminopimelate desuccinylase-like protein
MSLDFQTESGAAPSLKALAKLAIETPSTTGNEQAILDALKRLAEGSGTAPEIVETPFGMAIVWEGKDGKNAPLWLFDGHVDTVSVKGEEAGQWKTKPFEAVFEGEGDETYVYGKGSVDQQGGYLAAYKALLEMADQIPQSERNASVGIVLTRAEELAEGFASGKIHDALVEEGYGNIKGVVLTEPSNAEIMTGQMGRLRLRIKHDDLFPETLSGIISELARYERTSSITGEAQALTLIGGDVTGDYDGTIDSQVPDKVTAKFYLLGRGDVSDAQAFAERSLDEMIEDGELVEYSLESTNDGGALELSLTGQTAHSAFPEKGMNAGEALAKLTDALADEHPNLSLTYGRIGDGEMSGASSKGGVLFYDYRIDAGETPEAFIVEIRKLLVGSRGEDFGGDELEVEVYVQDIELDGDTHPVEQHFPAWSSSNDGALLTQLRDAVQTEFSDVGREVSEGAWGFCTNGSAWAKIEGMEVVGISPGDPGLAHQVDERCPLGETELVCRTFQRLIADLLK